MTSLAGKIFYWKATNGINPADVQPPPPPSKIQITSYGTNNHVGSGPGGDNILWITVDPNQKSAIISASSWTIYELGHSYQPHSMTYTGNDGSNVLYFDVGNYMGWQTDTFWYTP